MESQRRRELMISKAGLYQVWYSSYFAMALSDLLVLIVITKLLQPVQCQLVFPDKAKIQNLTRPTCNGAVLTVELDKTLVQGSEGKYLCDYVIDRNELCQLMAFGAPDTRNVQRLFFTPR